ncbi:MAG: hypothetical protein Q8P24_01565 [Desulfobacterales bacterium]|nr:hypothetical protein [Desulfobacterales bacterium]
MLRKKTLLKLFILAAGVFFLSNAQTGAEEARGKKFGSTVLEKACQLCHEGMKGGTEILWHESPLGQAGVTCVMRRLGYFERNLVRNLLNIGYPLDRSEVRALDITGMRFDGKNRIDLLAKILRERGVIHLLGNTDYFTNTEVIYDALRLLDEHNLPAVNKLVDMFNQQDGWEKGEKALLAFMAAKRNFRYATNVAYLTEMLKQSGNDLERIYKGEIFHVIIDQMNVLSFLADLFILKGDTDILNLLISYSLRTYGYPAEYLSHMFVDMFLLRPTVFISTLSTKNEATVNSMLNALVFGVSNRYLKDQIKDVLHKNFVAWAALGQGRMDFILNRFRTAVDQVHFGVPVAAE